MDQARRWYPSDLNDLQWAEIKSLIPAPKLGGRPRKTEMREVINAILYLTRSGCAWRYLPKTYPPWQTVYDYFVSFTQLGVWRKIHLILAQKARTHQGRTKTPSLLIVDGQSVKSQYGEERGWDGFKKVRGRKRQILVDTLGIIWAAKVHRANQQESTRGFEVLQTYPKRLKLPKILLGDSGYNKKPFNTWVNANWKKVKLECRQGTKEKYKNERGVPRIRVGESNLKPQRWIVERSFAWFNHSRRLSRDYEKKVLNSETFLYISQIPILFKKLQLE